MTPVGSWAGTSLCETCRGGREVRTARSRFLLCELSLVNGNYPKYPPQPVVRCVGYQPKVERNDAVAQEDDIISCTDTPT